MESRIAHRDITAGRRGHVLSRASGRGRRGYTLVEIVFVMTIIVVLMALTLVVVGGAVRQARVAAERMFLSSLRMGVEQFNQSFGFYPPLVEAVEARSVVISGARGLGMTTNDLGRASKFLQNEPAPNAADPRYSQISLSLYLLGLGDAPLDGYQGAGQGRPREDGTWDVGSPRVQPFVDVSRDAERVKGRTLVDRWGNAIRYYRWEPTLEPKYDQAGVLNPAVGEIKSHNIPKVLFDTGEKGMTRENNAGTGMRSGAFAIVSAGADGVIDEIPWSSRDSARDPVISTAPRPHNLDNLVEVGR